jgi:elongation factor Ts
MAEITAAMVKELRERTQAGMMDCKKALTEAGGDMAKAAEILAKSGKTKADNKQGKVAAEGLVNALLSADGRVGVLVEVNCQTDFVAKGDDFKSLLHAASNAALAHQTADADALNAVVVDGKTLAERANDLTARSGEKHSVRRVALFRAGDGSMLHSYIHHGSRIAVMVEVASSQATSGAVRGFADDVALQIASMSPRYLQKTEVPGEVVAKQREILSALMEKEDADVINEPAAFMKRVETIVVELAQEEGREVPDAATEARKLLETDEKFRKSFDDFNKAAEKVRARPAAQREKILDGKVAKWVNEVTLLEQISVRDSKKTIAQVQADIAKTVPGTTIARFARFEVGDGIEKAAGKDFATEVAEMAAAANKS